METAAPCRWRRRGRPAGKDAYRSTNAKRFGKDLPDRSARRAPGNLENDESNFAGGFRGQRLFSGSTSKETMEVSELPQAQETYQSDATEEVRTDGRRLCTVVPCQRVDHQCGTPGRTSTSSSGPSRKQSPTSSWGVAALGPGLPSLLDSRHLPEARYANPSAVVHSSLDLPQVDHRRLSASRTTPQDVGLVDLPHAAQRHWPRPWPRTPRRTGGGRGAPVDRHSVQV